MSLQHLILGLLKYGPMSGYDLNKTFAASVQHFWDTDQSLIYRALYKMTDEGWVEFEQQAQEHLPNKKLYRLTETGHTELRRWLATPQSALSFHEAWLGQLFFAAELNTAERKALLEARIASLRATLEVYENQVPGNISAFAEAFNAAEDSRYWFLTLDYGRHRLRSDIAWAEQALRLLDDPTGEEPGTDS